MAWWYGYVLVHSLIFRSFITNMCDFVMALLSRYCRILIFFGTIFARCRVCGHSLFSAVQTICFPILFLHVFNFYYFALIEPYAYLLLKLEMESDIFSIRFKSYFHTIPYHYIYVNISKITILYSSIFFISIVILPVLTLYFFKCLSPIL